MVVLPAVSEWASMGSLVVKANASERGEAKGKGKKGKPLNEGRGLKCTLGGLDHGSLA